MVMDVSQGFVLGLILSTFYVFLSVTSHKIMGYVSNFYADDSQFCISLEKFPDLIPPLAKIESRIKDVKHEWRQTT